MELDDEEIPRVTQLWSILSNQLNPITGTLLGYVTVFIDGIMFEMDRESLYDVNAWTHEFTELAIAKIMYGFCDGSYPFCKCDVDCGVPISWLGGSLGLPICHFIASLTSFCNLPNETGGYEKVDGDRVWSLAIAMP